VIGCSERCERLRLVARFAPAIAPSCSEVDFISAMFSLGRKQISDPRADGLIFWPEVLVGREFVGAALGCPVHGISLSKAGHRLTSLVSTLVR
jgi:hypothetical protein